MFSLSGNPGITDGRVYNGPTAAPAPILDTVGSKPKSNTSLIAGIIGGVVGAIVLIGCGLFIIWRRQKNKSKFDNTNNKTSIGSSSQGKLQHSSLS